MNYQVQDPDNFVLNSHQVPPSDSFPIYPAGTYTAFISKTEVQPFGEEGRGRRVAITFTFIGGSYPGRTHRQFYNFFNPTSSQNTEIAHRDLSAICHVTGIHTVSAANHFADLLNARLQIKLIVRKDQNGEDRNDIRGYFDLAGNGPGKANPQGAAGMPPQGMPQGSPMTGAPMEMPQGNAGFAGHPQGNPAGNQFPHGGAPANQPPPQQWAPDPSQGQWNGQQAAAPQGMQGQPQQQAPWGGGQPAPVAPQPQPQQGWPQQGNGQVNGQPAMGSSPPWQPQG